MIQKSTGILAVTVLGTTVSLSAIDWAQGDILDLFISAGGSQGTSATLRRNGGAATSAGTGASLGAIPTASPLRFFNDGTSCTANADVQFLAAW